MSLRRVLLSLPLNAVQRGFPAVAVMLLCGIASLPARAQSGDFDASWYASSQTYVKIAVVEDGVYRIRGEDLAQLGVAPSTIDPATLHLFENGREVPIRYEGAAGSINNGAEIMFVGTRNRGDDERRWAYREPEWQSSDYFSLYTDTTYYWLTWGRTATGLRYRASTSSTQPLPETNAFRDTLRIEDDRRYYEGDGNDAENPFYTRGEGYFSNGVLRSRDTDPVSFNLGQRFENLYRGDPNAPLHAFFRYNSITATRHKLGLEAEILVNGELSFTSFDEVDWTGYRFQTLTATIPVSQIPSDRRNFTSFRVTSFNDFNADPNIIYLDWIEFSFPRELVADDGRLRFSYSNQEARRMHLRGFGPDPVLVFSPRDRRVYQLTPESGEVTFADAPLAPPVYWAVSRDALRTPADLSVDRSSDWADADNEADYVILTTRALRPSAEALAEYRRTQNGFEVAVVDVQDVFDQFDYGRPTPIAIRRFVHRTQAWRTKPQYMIIWGDALYPDRTRPRPAWEVPAFGQASSDGWYAMQYGGPDDWTEVVAIGRIPIRSNSDGLVFLQKMQTYESQFLADWQKRALMLVGGRDAPEQRLLQSFVVPWAQRAVAAPTGMDTLNFFSNTDDPFGIEGAFQDSLRIAFREGASWLSYFGHSSAVVWDIVVDEPEDFDNATRLPIAISLGCRTGAFGGGSGDPNDTQTLAEQLVHASLNGAIAHWGSSGLGSISASRRMGDILHERVFSDTLRVLGPIFQDVKRGYVESGSFSLKELAQFGLIGDPATRLDIPTRPDFEMRQEQLRITPLAPVLADSNLTISVTLRNRGLVPADSIALQLLHTAPDGSTTPYVLRVPPFRLEQQVAFEVPITPAMTGDNRFQVVVDPDNEYVEVVETNNSAERTHVVFSTELSLIAPLEMSAVTSTLPRLRVTFVSRDEVGLPVVFELDSVPTFDSPALRTYRTVASGTFAVWQLTEPLAPGRAYYWRARIETPDGLVNWQSSSFFVEEGTDGPTWLQAGSLFDVNEQDFRLSREDNRWAFNTYTVNVQFSSSRGGPLAGQFVVESERFERLGLGFGMLIIDGYSGEVLASGSMVTYPNQFVDPADHVDQLRSMVAMLKEGDYVYIRTRHLANQGGPEISEEVKAIFRGLGSTAIDTLTYQDLWLMRTRFGHPDETQEWVDPPESGLPDIVEEDVLEFPYGEGITTSPLLGPARSWETLTWSASLENEASTVRVDVLDPESGAVLLDSLTTPGTVDLSTIDARAYPRLRLRATLSDSTQRSTPQLDRWGVHYGSIPELVLDAAAFTVSADTLDEGETLDVTGAVINLSDVPADSVVVLLSLTDAQNRTSLAAADTLGIGPNETATVGFTLGTEGLAGHNMLTLEAEQPNLPEPLTFNNIAFSEFTVRSDRVPPELHVTINGTELPHDPDPVRDLQDPNIPLLPPQPTIEIVLTDENPFKLLTDTSLVTITLNDERVSFSRPDVQFEPATADRNEARIVFTPDFTGQDAVFTLRVTGADVESNEAIGSPYQVHFRIESTFEIGSIYPYPNPMNDFTRFSFLIKGLSAAVIDDFRIRIYTLTGRVVKEFNLVKDPSPLEAGSLHIGWNKLRWDGRDEDGDLLATGVYLYKVYMKVDGEEVTINNDSGIEKLVVLR